MSKSSKYWDKRAIKRLSDAEKMSDGYINKIKTIYNQAYRNIEKEIASVYKNYSKDTGVDIEKLRVLLTKKETDKVWKTLERQGLTKYIKDNYKSRISRLEQIQAQLYAKAKLIYPKEELAQRMCYKGVINDSYYKTLYDTQMGTGFDFSFNRIDNNMTQALLNENWSGKNYSQRIWGNTDILANNLSQIIGGSLVSGQGIEKTSKQVRDVFNVSKYYSERLVRTETNHFNNTADAMAYEEMGIDKYVFVATLDSRTSIMCQDMDGQVFEYKDKEEGYNFPPLHPNCRSKTRGYLGEDAEKLLQRRARNPITGKTEIIDNMSYKKWVEKNKLYENTKKPQLKYKTENIINKTRNIVSKSLQNKTKGVTINRADINYSFYSPQKNTITLGKTANEYSLIHELGHKLQSVLTKQEKKDYEQLLINKFSKYTKKDFKRVNGSSGKYWILKDSSDFVSGYQTRIYNRLFSFKKGKPNVDYALEYLSEGLKYYYKQPELLYKKDKELYNFIDKVVK